MATRGGTQPPVSKRLGLSASTLAQSVTLSHEHVVASPRHLRVLTSQKSIAPVVELAAPAHASGSPKELPRNHSAQATMTL